MFRIVAAAAAVVVVLAAGTAQAARFDPGAIALPRVSRALPEGAFTLAPMAFVQFCLTSPAQCVDSGPTQVELSQERWQELMLVNAEVNARIEPRLGVTTDWRVDATVGDCNDFALQKRDELLRRGWPSAALLLAVVQTRGGDYHLVLTIRSDRGDLVLDNLRPSIVAWDHAGYRWLKRQSSAQPRFWVRVG